MNSQSVLAHYDELEHFLKSHQPAVLCLTETHLTEDIENKEISVEGYNLVRVDSHSRHTGGVMCYIHSQIHYVNICKYIVHKNYWVLVVKLELVRYPVMLCILYRSPAGSQLSFLQFFEDLCQDLLSISVHPLLIAGDFNLDWKSDLF